MCFSSLRPVSVPPLSQVKIGFLTLIRVHLSLDTPVTAITPSVVSCRLVGGVSYHFPGVTIPLLNAFIFLFLARNYYLSNNQKLLLCACTHPYRSQ